MKQWEKGTEYLLHSIGLDSTNSVGYYNLSQASKSLENYDLCKHALEEAIHWDSSYASAWLNLGSLYYGHYRDPEKAIAVSKSGFQLNPEKLKLASNIAGISAMIGVNDVAEEYANIVLARKPHDIPMLNVMGIIQSNRGNHEKAIEIYEQILIVDPNYANAYSNIGVANIELGRLDEAEANLQIALEINPRNVNTLSELGETYRIRRQLEKSYDYYYRAYEIRNDKNSVIANLILNCQYRGLWDEAEKFYLHWIEVDPDNNARQASFAHHFILQEKWDKAHSILEDALQEDSSDLVVNFSMAITLLNIDGNQERAINYYNKFLNYLMMKLPPG